jgi:hypothetical protein
MSGIPRPLAADATVTIDAHARTLVVKPAKDARGHAKLVSSEGHHAPVEDFKAGSSAKCRRSGPPGEHVSLIEPGSARASDPKHRAVGRGEHQLVGRLAGNVLG